ncbi:MAG: hypothetical protein K9L30_10810 [Desulfobacterales bacterium]|nr:hypothetical protein [Desulfobacterales bacterium]
MKTSCQYHPGKPAHWYCPECNQNFCPECIDKRDKGGYQAGEFMYFCSNCNVELTWIAAENTIEPFWSRLPRFFKYPLKPAPLIFNCIITLIYLLFDSIHVFGFLFKIILWFLLLKYAFTAFTETAKGNLVPPEISSRTISENMHQVLKQYILYILLFAIGFGFLFTGPFSLILLPVYILYVVLFLPAMIMLLVSTDSVIHALNPQLTFGLVFRIGRGYLLMFFFYGLLGSAPALLGAYAANILPGWLAVIVYKFAENYYTILTFHLMGYVLLQYHKEIGYEIELENFQTEDTDTKAEKVEPAAVTLNRVNRLIQEGNHDEAISTIKVEIDKGIEDVNLSDRYFSLLKINDRTDEILEYGVTYLTYLTLNNKEKEAREVYKTCMAVDSNFTPDASALFKLGSMVSEKDAIDIYTRLIEKYPDSPDTPVACFRCAQIYNDRLMMPDKAAEILRDLMYRFPDHEIALKARNYLEYIGKD